MSDPGGGEVGSNLYDLLGIPLAQSGTNPSPFGWGAISQAIFHPGTGLVLPPGGGAYDPSTGTNLGPSVPGAAGSYRGDSGGGLIGSGSGIAGAVPFDDYGYPASPQKEYFSILDFICGFGDELGLGLPKVIRGFLGVDHVVNVNSSSYRWGQVASAPLDLALGGKGALKYAARGAKALAGARNAQRAVRAAAAVDAAVARGLTFQRRVLGQPLTENIESLTGTAKFRRPDRLDRGARTLEEVKSVRVLCRTRQIEDYRLWCEANGFRFIIRLDKSVIERISKPMKELQKSGAVTIILE